MVFSALEQLEALVESLGVLIGHCHGISGHAIQTDSRGWCVDHGIIEDDS